MHTIIKSSFYVIFLVAMFSMGTIMFFKPKKNSFNKFYGIMALIIGIGEAFYLIPRIIYLFSDSLETFHASLELGRLISSITIVLGFVLLYRLWRLRYKITGYKRLTITVFILAVLSIVLSLLLRNVTSPLYPIRIVPFVFIGLIMILAFYRESHKEQDKTFRHMWLAITLSFVFFIPIELLSDTFEAVIILMLPKNLMYIWIIGIGFNAYRKERI